MVESAFGIVGCGQLRTVAAGGTSRLTSKCRRESCGTGSEDWSVAQVVLINTSFPGW